ncbi:MAG: ribonuclease HIII [Culicoidibacterales bacterium]
MSVLTLLVDESTLIKMTAFYADHLQKTPQHARFQAKIPNCTITAYNSKKVVFQGNLAETEAQLWQQFSGNSQAVKKSDAPPASLAPKWDLATCIGCDESGVGDYFGPVTAACILIPQTDVERIRALGITDSKKMTDSIICQLAPLLMAEFPHAITLLPNSKYNHLQAQGIHGHMMKTLLHNQALTKLLQENQCQYDYIIMDQFVNERAYYRYFDKLKVTPILGLSFLPKAESHCVAVAAASVLARYTYVKAMEKLAEKLGESLPKGANQRVDQFAAQLISKHGLEFLDQYAKIHFATTQKAIVLTR